MFWADGIFHFAVFKSSFRRGTTPHLERGHEGRPPFAIKKPDGSWTGISIELWRRLADELNLEYEFREYDMPQIVARLQAGELDAAIAAISITADRDQRFDFSHAYYSTGLGVAVPRRETISFWRFIARLFTARFFAISAGLVILAMVAGMIFWKLERRKNEGLFGGRAKEGVGLGLWWSTIMLLGHKGIIPATATARLLALLVMITSTIAVSALTGVITSAMTVARIGHVVRHPDDLRHLRIATVSDSTSVQYLQRRHLAYREHDVVSDALQSLAKGEAEAVVFDLGMLKYQTKTQFADSIEVLPIQFNVQQYAIGLTPNSDLRRKLNQVLLEVTASDEWADILYRYLGG